MRIFNKIYNKLNVYAIYYRTLIKCGAFEVIPRLICGEVIFRGANVGDVEQLALVYKKLNGVELSLENIRLIKSCARKLVLVVEEKIEGKDKIFGINFFYLNSRDFREQTIHEGFIGVLPEYEGRGIATQMRKLAIEHFKKAGFKGISTRISKNNIGSLRSAEKLGFKPIEGYFDSNMGEERYYLICRLENNFE